MYKQLVKLERHEAEAQVAVRARDFADAPMLFRLKPLPPLTDEI